MLSRLKSSAKDADKSDPSSHTNYRFLTTPEKVQRLHRLHRLHTTTRVQHQKISHLRSQIAQLVDERGIIVDEDLHNDLASVMESNNGTIILWCAYCLELLSYNSHSRHSCDSPPSRFLPIHLLGTTVTGLFPEGCTLHEVAPTDDPMVSVPATSFWQCLRDPSWEWCDQTSLTENTTWLHVLHNGIHWLFSWCGQTTNGGGKHFHMSRTGYVCGAPNGWDAHQRGHCLW